VVPPAFTYSKKKRSLIALTGESGFFTISITMQPMIPAEAIPCSDNPKNALQGTEGISAFDLLPHSDRQLSEWPALTHKAAYSSPRHC
jgi:hypothetical protein